MRDNTSNSRLTDAGARSFPRRVMDARRARLNLSIRSGVISSRFNAPNSWMSTSVCSISDRQDRLFSFDYGRYTSLTKEPKEGAVALSYLPL